MTTITFAFAANANRVQEAPGRGFFICRLLARPARSSRP
jgi:hypothetical protein